MVARVSLPFLCVLAIVAVVATSGNLRAGTVLWGDDFSVDTPANWDYYPLVDGAMTVTGGEVAFSGGSFGPYGYPSLALRLADQAQLAPVEEVTAACVAHMGTPDEDLYLGPVVRANITGYYPATYQIEGTGYGYLLSGYDRGGVGNGEAGLYLWLGTSDESLLLMGIPDALGFTDTDVYMKLTARTLPTGVQLDGMMSLSPDFSNPFGVISYLHDDPVAMLDHAGQAGIIGYTSDGNDYGTLTGTLDDFVASKPSGPGDANDDNQVDLLDLGAVGDNWNGTGKRWDEGDFTFDGNVDLLDLGVVGDNWGTTYTEGAATDAVPEPSTLTLLVLGAMAALVYRRKRSLL